MRDGKYIEYVKNLKAEVEEFKKTQTKEELDVFNKTIDLYMLWSAVQGIFRTHRHLSHAIVIYFTPLKKDEENEKGKI